MKHLKQSIRKWWLVRRADGELYGLTRDTDPVEWTTRVRAARQLLRDAGWTDARIDPWLNARIR